MNMIILGIDPGVATTGFALLEQKNQRLRVLDYGCIITKKNTSFPLRLKQIYQELSRIIKKYRPSIVAVEEVFFYKNTKTALAVGHAKGVIILAAALANAEVKVFTPLQVKQMAVGYGRADKKQVQKIIQQHLGLKELPRPDDAADALAIAYCCSAMKNFEDRIK